MIRIFLILFICFTSSIYAEGEPLNVGIEIFDPPFIMQSANHEIYGFDIDLMNGLCKIINRTCKYHIMQFDQLFDAITNRKIDVAISSITITPERSKIVNFSLPYLLSYSRFLESRSAPNKPFNLDLLNSKKIGLQTGTVFSDQIIAMGVKNPIIKKYTNIENLLNGLNNGEVDLIMLDSATAVYWASNSSDSFKLLGPPYMYGYGYGIAINPSDSELLTALNRALIQYQNSDDYKQDYNSYLPEY